MGQLAGFLQGHMLLSKSSTLTLQLKEAACLLCKVSAILKVLFSPSDNLE